MTSSSALDQPSSTRVILLGASNLTLGIAGVVETARLAIGGPLQFLIAMGHGRSYGRRSSVLGRSLPGISECGLWEALRRDSASRSFALLTDIGNDVAYGASVDSIQRWVAECLDRLADVDARIVLTLLPMESLQALSRWRFEVARAILFPGRRLSLDDALARSRELDDRLRELGRRPNIRLAENPGRFYGVDPIHIRRRCRAAVWAQLMRSWGVWGAWGVDGSQTRPLPRASLGRWLRIRLATPERWWFLGRRRGRPQPSGRLADGSTIALY